MKIVTPCCQHLQEWNPLAKYDPKKRYKTKCKNCKKQINVKKDHIVKETLEQPRETKGDPKKQTEAKGDKVEVSTGGLSTSPDIIDDPDELLISVATRELNRPQPDPRWASILLQCRKEIGKRKGVMMEQLVKLPTSNLIEILKKQSGKSSQEE